MKKKVMLLNCLNWKKNSVHKEQDLKGKGPHLFVGEESVLEVYTWIQLNWTFGELFEIPCTIESCLVKPLAPL